MHGGGDFRDPDMEFRNSGAFGSRPQDKALVCLNSSPRGLGFGGMYGCGSRGIEDSCSHLSKHHGANRVSVNGRGSRFGR